ncbi:hypothetical protein TUM20985_56680 [Mycobacterium antarcticum]|uniref:hypothetical protein n=1 Tax=Mycolicibacterium sp. TUM20985 TaxID=3023370 RepID=UPI0025746EB8|nr:hypothetical protein [Mycolicibacterium sp. TUM20985]BDX35121.1 hypothetical protein TUM20985_56680 [Mycolicibacterium sp. TUM20985]
MPDWVWLVIVAMVVIAGAVLAVALVTGRRKRTHHLKERFGPEYDRAVAASGDHGAAERELVERERKRDELEIVPLTSTALQEYTSRWKTVQTAFVDDPTSAVGEADDLVTEVMRERGYPVDDFEQRAADVSVDHPTVVENYRAAHAIHLAHRRGDVGTEQQRQAFVHYRALFERLLERDADTTRSRPTETAQETRA